jgi:hypothetical protein
MSTPGQQNKKDYRNLAAKRTDIYCTGFISELPPRTELKIVGALMENSKREYSQGDIVFLNRGREGGVYPGALYYVIRPAGKFKHPFNRKAMGHYVRELGMLQVVEVHDKTATAEIVVSCDAMTLGDLLRSYEAVESPALPEGHPLNRYGEGTGDTTGQIVLSRGFHEFVGTNNIVHIDLGLRHGVRPGDNFTVFRAIGPGEGVTKFRDDKVGYNRSRGFGSERFKGGDFSISGTAEKPNEVIEQRPSLPRKVLGELVILKVENTASVAVITQSLSEINIGDFVERAN